MKYMLIHITTLSLKYNINKRVSYEWGLIIISTVAHCNTNNILTATKKVKEIKTKMIHIHKMCQFNHLITLKFWVFTVK